MGKIFDALQKSEKEPSKSAHDHSKKTDSVKKVLPERNQLVPSETAGNKIPVMERLKTGGHETDVDDNVICAKEPKSFVSEQFKMLRSRILFPSSGEPPRTIMITSALPGEGKSFVASNLAVSIAQNINEYVLLMDCDLRIPSIGGLFGLGNSDGLSEYLTSGVELDDLLVKTGIEKLTILPGGNPPPNPAELLSSKRMSDLIQEVRSRYKDRFIIIDSPPPHITAEARVIAGKVDGILLVIGYGDANRMMITDMVELLGKEKILGVVFNRVRSQSSKYYAYGKYGRYGKYAKYGGE